MSSDADPTQIQLEAQPQREPNDLPIFFPTGPFLGPRKEKGFTSSRRKPLCSLECRGQDLNLHDLAATRPSTWRVCQFRHLGNCLHAIIPSRLALSRPRRLIVARSSDPVISKTVTVHRFRLVKVSAIENHATS